MDKLRNFWENRKARAIVFIVCYIILFGYIFIFYGNKNPNPYAPDPTPEKTEKKVYNSYEYEYKKDSVINVTKYNDIVAFKIGEDSYYYINNKTYKLEDEKLHETKDPLKYNFDYLNKLDEMKELSSLVKTTTYADKSIEENYDVNLSQLLNLFGHIEEVDNKEMLNYSIFYENNVIKKITLNTFDIEINYTNLESAKEIKITAEFDESEV